MAKKLGLMRVDLRAGGERADPIYARDSKLQGVYFVSGKIPSVPLFLRPRTGPEQGEEEGEGSRAVASGDKLILVIFFLRKFMVGASEQ